MRYRKLTCRKIAAEVGDHISIRNAHYPPEHSGWNKRNRIAQHLAGERPVGAAELEIAPEPRHNKEEDYRKNVGGDYRENIAVNSPFKA